MGIDALRVARPLYHTRPRTATLSCTPAHFSLLPRQGLSVDLSEHKIHRTDNGDRVRQESVSHHEVGALEMGESWCSDLALVWSLGSVRDEVNSHLSLGRLDRGVGLTWRDGVSLGEDL